MLQKFCKIMEAVVSQTFPICVSPTGKVGVYALYSVLTFYATKKSINLWNHKYPGPLPMYGIDSYRLGVRNNSFHQPQFDLNSS
jgi:hypothetical protein